MNKEQIESLKRLCPKLDNSCVEGIKSTCPDLDAGCLSQMDYYLVGKENFNLSEVPHKKSKEYFDAEYFNLCETVIKNGRWQINDRTGKACLTYIGASMKFDMEDTDCFPLLTTKKMAYKPLIAELLGFVRGLDNAKDFRDLGCRIWDANANESKDWIENPNRKGVDDLGRIYGVQARDWRAVNYKQYDSYTITNDKKYETIDQLANVIDKIVKRLDDRRLIVSHWNPGELSMMSLPPCHLLYQFSIVGDVLHLCLYQRSADIPLGVPFNIASYALLLKMIAKITGLKCGTFTHFIANAHIYEDQLDLLYKQLERTPQVSPSVVLPEIESLRDLETWVLPENFIFENYTPDPTIKFPFSA